MTSPSLPLPPPSTPGRILQRLWALEKFSYALRVFIGLAGVMAACWLFDAIRLIIPLFLGVIAAALAETDDSWQGRLAASAITVALFALSAFVVELLTPYPPLFLAGIMVSVFTFTMTGALGARYATIAQATVILAVYTMLGLEQGGPSGNLWLEPLVLSLGAAWYSFLSVLSQAMFRFHPVQHGLAGLFTELGGYLQMKASLFEPTRQSLVSGRRVDLARQNGRVVIELNRVKEIIRIRSGGDPAQVWRYLSLFFMAQDVHERASSSHYPYEEFAEAFFHSDVMFRCQRLLSEQGRACVALARAIRQGGPFVHGESRQAMADLEDSLDHLRKIADPAQQSLLPSLTALVDNLAALENELAHADESHAQDGARDVSLFDDNPRSLADAWRRITQNLTPFSSVFRHALRLTLALGAGYGVKYFVHPTQGYWILLTTLFVCQPNYAQTRQRLWQRIFGTILGLVAGWALITLFPAPEIQRLFAVAAGVAFFVYRTNRYSLATGAITVMVVCCFNQVVNGYGIIWPRMFDTVMGAVISGLAVFFVLPDWQGRQLHKAVAATLSGASGYLRELLRQYGTGKHDDLAYRVARRNAHAADAALSAMLSNMLGEPGRYRKDAETCLHNLVMSHTLLGYLSALGAHRGAAGRAPGADVAAFALAIADRLDAMADALAHRRPVTSVALPPPDLPADASSEADRLLVSQLRLIGGQLAKIRALAGELQESVSS